MCSGVLITGYYASFSISKTALFAYSSEEG